MEDASADNSSQEKVKQQSKTLDESVEEVEREGRMGLIRRGPSYGMRGMG